MMFDELNKKIDKFTNNLFNEDRIIVSFIVTGEKLTYYNLTIHQVMWALNDKIKSYAENTRY